MISDDPLEIASTISNGSAKAIIWPERLLGDSSAALGRNLAVIVAPAANPANVTGLAAFAAVVNDPACPLLSISDLASGRLDAALMFRRNTAFPATVRVVDVPEKDNLIVDFGYRLLDPSGATKTFGQFLASDTAKLILIQNGYLP